MISSIILPVITAPDYLNQNRMPTLELTDSPEERLKRKRDTHIIVKDSKPDKCSLNCLTYMLLDTLDLKLIGTKIFEGIQYISNDHYDKECSSVIKSSSIFEKASCYNKVKYGCRIIHEIELDHKFLGTDIKCCWGIKINGEVKTSKFNLRIFNNTCIVLI